MLQNPTKSKLYEIEEDWPTINIKKKKLENFV